MKNEARLVSITSNAEELVAYCARVSNPKNQNNRNVAGLLSYCVTHSHWSIFEQANLVIEINTTRAISAQILRHRSFSFQEFSQRYSEADTFSPFQARRQDESNRQNSLEDLDNDTQNWFLATQEDIWQTSHAKYKEALDRGIAKECARALLPLNTSTTLYMNGTIRSWIHYIQLRTQKDTQKEHRQIAERCRCIFVESLPATASALGWS